MANVIYPAETYLPDYSGPGADYDEYSQLRYEADYAYSYPEPLGYTDTLNESAYYCGVGEYVNPEMDCG